MRGRSCRRRQNERVEAEHVSLLPWLRRQLREPTALREHLEAAVENDDHDGARHLLAQLPFNDGQRRNVEHLLGAWERTLTAHKQNRGRSLSW